MSSEERKKEYLAQAEDERSAQSKKTAQKVKGCLMVFGLSFCLALTPSCDYSIDYEHYGPTIINPPPAEENPQEPKPDKPMPPVENKEIDRIIDRILANSSSIVDGLEVETLRGPLQVLGNTKEGREVLRNTPESMGIQIVPFVQISSSRNVEYSSDRNIHTTKISSRLLDSDYIHQAPLLLAETFVMAAERQYIFDRFPTLEHSLTEQGEKNMNLLTQAAVKSMDYQLVGELKKYDPSVYTYGSFDYEYNIKSDDVWNWEADVNLKMDVLAQGQPSLTPEEKRSLYAVAVSDKKADFYREFLSEGGYAAGSYADWLVDYQVSGQTQKLLNALSYHTQYKNQRLSINELFNDTRTDGIRPASEKENGGSSGNGNGDKEHNFTYSPETGIITSRSLSRGR